MTTTAPALRPAIVPHRLAEVSWQCKTSGWNVSSASRSRRRRARRGRGGRRATSSFQSPGTPAVRPVSVDDEDGVASRPQAARRQERLALGAADVHLADIEGDAHRYFFAPAFPPPFFAAAVPFPPGFFPSAGAFAGGLAPAVPAAAVAAVSPGLTLGSL